MCGCNDGRQETGLCFQSRAMLCIFLAKRDTSPSHPLLMITFSMLFLKKQNKTKNHETHISGLLSSHAHDKPVFLNKTNSSPNIKKNNSFHFVFLHTLSLQHFYISSFKNHFALVNWICFNEVTEVVMVCVCV